jgi:hypothetical protein
MRLPRTPAALALATALALAASRTSAQPTPHARYASLLRASVRGPRVDHLRVRASLADLRAYCDWLATHGPTSTPGEFRSDAARKAYWLNAYNALVLRAVAEAPPTMRNVLTHLPDGGFFRARTHRVDGRALTLDAIENQELRRRFGDPRVHVALNCAARSCPPLAPEPFMPARVDAQLDARARAWVASGAYQLDATHRVLRVSSLLQWFAEDFTAPIRARAEPPPGPTNALSFLYQFAARPAREAIERACGPRWSDCRVEYVPYDWTLNDLR